MSKLTIEFELSEDAAVLDGRRLSVDLGSGVHLVTDAPRGIERINSVKMQIVMDVEGNLSAAHQASVVQLEGTSDEAEKPNS